MKKYFLIPACALMLQSCVFIQHEHYNEAKPKRDDLKTTVYSKSGEKVACVQIGKDGQTYTIDPSGKGPTLPQPNRHLARNTSSPDVIIRDPKPPVA